MIRPLLISSSVIYIVYYNRIHHVSPKSGYFVYNVKQNKAKFYIFVTKKRLKLGYILLKRMDV